MKDLGGDGVLVDCCSRNIASVVKPKLLQESGVRVVTCVFGPSVYAKRARRCAVKN